MAKNAMGAFLILGLVPCILAEQTCSADDAECAETKANSLLQSDKGVRQHSGVDWTFDGKCYVDSDHSASHKASKYTYTGDPASCLNVCEGEAWCAGVTYKNYGSPPTKTSRGDRYCMYHTEAVNGGSQEDKVLDKDTNKAYDGFKCWKKTPVWTFDGKCFVNFEHSAKHNAGKFTYTGDPVSCAIGCNEDIGCTGVTYKNYGTGPTKDSRGDKYCMYHTEAVNGGSQEDKILGKDTDKAYAGFKCWKKPPVWTFDGKCFVSFEHSAKHKAGKFTYTNDPASCIVDCDKDAACTGVTYKNYGAAKYCMYHTEAVNGGSQEDQILGKDTDKCYAGFKCYQSTTMPAPIAP